MANVHLVLSTIQPGARAGVTIIPSSAVEAAETIETSGASQPSEIAAPAGDDGARFWSVTVTGGNAWLAFGSEPDAVAGECWLVLDGERLEFAAVGGDKAAVLSAWAGCASASA